MENFTDEEREFLQAIDQYKRLGRLPGTMTALGPRPFPTWREVLAVVRALGYRREVDRRASIRRNCVSHSTRGLESGS